MSLRRLNKIAFQFAQELIRRLKAPNSVLVQKAAENVLKKVGVGVPLPLRKPARLPFRRTILRGFRHVVRQRFPLLRPFATLHFHQQRLRELDQARRNGFLLMKEQPGKRDVLQRIRNIFGTNVRYNQALAVTEMPDRLDGYEIGQHIAKGCNGAVYELRLQMERNGEEISQRMDSFNGFPLALKIMFNYQFDAPEHVLWREMGPELVPLAKPPSGLQGGRMANIKTLPRPHPNLIKLHTAFIDRMPVLPGADQLYPDALPNLSDYQGLREPKTLFVIMKRYRMTLHEYLGTHKRNLWVGRLLVGQLLEAVVFLHQNRICHRDMKSDNVLLDFDSDEEVPHLVLSDFGSALATGSWVQPFRDEYANLGGNMAIRAPEVRRARHGPNAVVDFEMADIWAAGTLAYEIFTKRNPFYALLSSAKYTEADLPPLPHRLIEPIKRLVGQMLRVNPRERPKPEVAANVLAISLFRFGNDIRQFFQSCGLHWFWSVENMRSAFSDINEKVERKIGDLTELYATETILARLIDPAMISRAELQLRATFLSRVDRDGLRPALRYFFDDRDGIASAMDNGMVNGDVSFFPNAKSTSQCE